MFNYQWDKEEDYSGYALIHDDAVVGMMAMAFSRRDIGGATHRFCNLHTWWVHDDHRGRSVAMLRPLLGLDGYTITHFTPCDRVRALTKRLGFADLDLQMKLLLPLTGFSKRRRPGSTLLFDPSIDEPALSTDERRILQDHAPYRVNSLLVRDGDKVCFVLYTHVERYRVRYCHLHYIGDMDVFVRNEHAIRSAIMQRHGVWFVALEKRRVHGIAFDRSLDFWAPAHAVYRPADGIRPEQIDMLYSDVVMLRLAAMPHISHEIGDRVQQLLQRWQQPGAAGNQTA